MKKSFFLIFEAAAAAMVCLSACDDTLKTDNGENDNPEEPSEETRSIWVIAGSSTEATYLLQSESIEASAHLVTTEGAGFEQDAATHWLFPENKYAYGLKYSQGNASECVSYTVNAQGNLEQRTIAMEMPNFTAFGTYRNYLLLGAAAAIQDGSSSSAYPYGINFTIVDAQAQTRKLANLVTEDMLGDGQYCTLSGFIPVGDKIYTAICPAGFSSYGIENGKAAGYEHLITSNRYSGEKTIASPIYPNSIHIGIFEGVDNFDKVPSKIIKDDRISLAASRYRSQYYPTFCLGENGYLYVFSNSYSQGNENEEFNTSHPAGVIRLNTATDTFDKDYYVNIETATQAALGEKHSFFQVWHMGGDKFLMQTYDNAVPDFTFTAINTFGIFDAIKGTYTPVKGFPALSEISEVGRFAYAEDGKVYLPVTLLNSDPAVYIIDAATATATKGVSVKADGGISAVWKMHN